MTLDTALSSLLLLLVFAGAVTDLRSGTIPNLLTLPAAALALLVRLAVGGGAALGEGALGLLLTFVGPWVVFQVTRGTGIGGGDVKLLAAVGAFTGPIAGIRVLIGSCLVMVLYALFLQAWRGQLIATLAHTQRILRTAVMRRPLEPQGSELALTSLRMGPFIALATLIVVGAPRVREVPSWLLLV